VETEYDSDYNCEAYGCDSICRCCTIENARVTEVDTWSIAEYLVGETDPILLYCVDRLLVASRIHEDWNWYVDIGGSYYGDEIDGVRLEGTTEINKRLAHLYSLDSDSERIKYVLIEEYGYLLDTLKDLEFSLEEMRREDIRIANTSMQKRITGDLGPYLKETWNKGKRVSGFSYTGPVCVVRENSNGEMVLVDGYHRYSASEKREINTAIKVIVGRPTSDSEKT
jgi:hypothetical protein